MQEEIAEKRRIAKERLKIARLKYNEEIQNSPTKKLCQNKSTVIECKCEKISETLFQFTYDHYDEDLLVILESIQSKSYGMYS